MKIKTRLATTTATVLAVYSILLILVFSTATAATMSRLDFPLVYLEDDDYLYVCLVNQRPDMVVGCQAQDKTTQEHVIFLCQAIAPEAGWIKDCVLTPDIDWRDYDDSYKR